MGYQSIIPCTHTTRHGVLEHLAEVWPWCSSGNELAVPGGIWASALGHETRCHQEPQRGTGTLHHGQTEAWCDAPDRVPGVEQLKSGTKSRNCQDLVGTGLFVWEVFSNFWVVLERTTYLDGSFLGPAENLVFR